MIGPEAAAVRGPGDREEINVQFTGIVKAFDEDEGVGTIVRDRDQHEIVVRAVGLALGVSGLSAGDRVAFDVDLGVNPQARNVMLA